jgi:tRNA pseudouridine55 synthase
MEEYPFNFLDGEVLLIDKELTWTSFDVVNALRSTLKRQMNIKKIKVGHAGTLDPLATGLLIICTGKATKTIDTLQAKDKVYSGIIQLGATRPSYDKETEIDETFDTEGITEEMILECAKSFEGESEQVPPVFSAIKVNGERAYTKARKNEDIELKKRKINIEYFKVTKIEMPNVHFEIKCTKGTYIRSIAYDFGQKLNNGAFLEALRREKIGEFDVKDALKVDQMKDLIHQMPSI